jgi:hypothetical protein
MEFIPYVAIYRPLCIFALTTMIAYYLIFIYMCTQCIVEYVYFRVSILVAHVFVFVFDIPINDLQNIPAPYPTLPKI